MTIAEITPPRDSETRNLFNPAFCALLLNRMVANYEAKADAPMPLTFAYVGLPAALHQPTRSALPRSTAASMWPWIRSNPVLFLDLGQRVRDFRPFTSSAITFGLRHGVLRGSLGSLAAGTVRRRPRSLRPTADWSSCLDAAEFLGRWFGDSGSDEATMLAQWGVRP
jgi:hypothetical protein